MPGTKRLHVEVPAFCFLFASMLSAPVVTNLVIYRTCYVTLGYNETECALLGSTNANENTAKLEELVQPHANLIGMAGSLLDGILGCIICLFLGPWSDIHGRKPVLISCLLGYICVFLVTALYTLFPYASPWWLLLRTGGSLFGGLASFFSVCLGYITDVTVEENRGIRIGVFEAALTVGIIMGTLVSSYLFVATSYMAVLLISAGFIVMGLLFTIFYIPESIPTSDSQVHIRTIFSTTNVREMLKAVFRYREKYNRTVLLLLVLLLMLYVLTISDSSTTFLYLREKFHWSLQQYTLFSSLKGGLSVLGTLFVVYVLHKLLKIPESVLLIVGFLSVLNGALLYGLASTDWHIYAGGCLKLLGGGISPMGRSLVSKITAPEEVGKVFALLVTFEMLAGIISSSLYTLVYNSTINQYPAAFNFVTAGIYTFEIFIVLYVILLQKKQENFQYKLLHEDNVN